MAGPQLPRQDCCSDCSSTTARSVSELGDTKGGALYDQSAHVIVVTGRGAGSVLRNSCAASGILSPDKFVSQERRANHNCGLHTSHYSTLPS